MRLNLNIPDFNAANPVVKIQTAFLLVLTGDRLKTGDWRLEENAKGVFQQLKPLETRIFSHRGRWDGSIFTFAEESPPGVVAIESPALGIREYLEKLTPPSAETEVPGQLSEHRT